MLSDDVRARLGAPQRFETLGNPYGMLGRAALAQMGLG